MSILNMIIIALNLGVIQGAPTPPPPPTYNFSYAVVAFQWPMALCATTHCTKPIRPESFRLHGVWPTNADGSPFSFCKGPTYSGSKIKEIRLKLQTYWPNYHGKDDDFWREQWTKHGVCSGQTQEDYFKNSLALYIMNYIRIINSLHKKGIKPTSGTHMRSAPTVLLIHDAIKEVLELVPRLYCATYRGNKYLLEVRLCANPDLKSFRDCPPPQLVGCGKWKSAKDERVLFYQDSSVVQ